MTNPMDYLDLILSDYASPKARRTIHSLILLAGAVVTIVLAAGGDWKVAVFSLLAALYAGANRANTTSGNEGSEEMIPLPDESVSGNGEGI